MRIALNRRLLALVPCLAFQAPAPAVGSPLQTPSLAAHVDSMQGGIQALAGFVENHSLFGLVKEGACPTSTGKYARTQTFGATLATMDLIWGYE
jgi:hypothetical protein